MWVCPDVLLLYTIWVNSNDNDTDADENKTKQREKINDEQGGRRGGARTFGRTDGRVEWSRTEWSGVRAEPSRVGLIHLIDFERGTISVVRGL